MRIVYIHQYYANLRMSGGTRSYELGRRLAGRGHEVHMVTTDRDAASASWRWRRTRDDGIHVHWLPVPYDNSMSYRRRAQAFARFATAATAKAASLRGDVVLATSTPLTVSVPGVLAARVRRVPFVFEVRDLWPEVPIELGALPDPVVRASAVALARWTYRHADTVVALSPGMADGVAAHGFPRERLVVVPNACDVDLLTPDPAEVRRFRAAHDWLQDRPLVLYAGTVGHIHGLDYLVRLAAEAAGHDPELRFLVVGDGRELASVQQLARDLGVHGKSMVFLPPVRKADMATVLGAASLATSLVIPVPGLRHNSANKFFDALAAGRPVAVNHGGWQAELLERHGAGLALPATDPVAGARLLVEHLADARWVSAASASARRLAEEEFSRDLLFARFERALTEAASRRGGTRTRLGRGTG